MMPFTITGTHHHNKYVRTCNVLPNCANFGDEQHACPIAVTRSELIQEIHTLLFGHTPVHRHHLDSIRLQYLFFISPSALTSVTNNEQSLTSLITQNDDRKSEYMMILSGGKGHPCCSCSCGGD